MGKKIEEADVKKECPSCGLGVALDSTVCEFCGWDFAEEDEWILQIEKLERDLMLEKQKFEPGTMENKIESTIHTPALERIEIIKAKQEANSVIIADPPPRVTPSPPRNVPTVVPAQMPAAKGIREARPTEMQVDDNREREMPRTQEPTDIASERPPQRPSSKVRRVRTLKAAPVQKAQPDAAKPSVRKVKT